MKYGFMALLLCCILILTGCAVEQATEAEGLKIVATIFPPYDFTRELTKGTPVSLSMLMKPGVESHSFDPSPADILSLKEADLFVCIGGSDEAWVDKMLESLGNEAPSALRLINTVEPLAADDHGHSLAAVDEHIWTAPKNAISMCEAVCGALCEADPQHCETYKANLDSYKKDLEALDRAFREAVQGGVRREVVFGDRFPFRHLAHAYDLAWHSPFAGCSGESEPDAAQIAVIIDLVKGDRIPVIFHIEGSDARIARMIAEETGAEIALLHSCHNLTKEELAAGESYLTLMKKNAQTLKRALDGEAS
ncbi:MAG: zinc ABC transporter substrate-binding protein [Clostridiales bacterium]|nr:zinc ABC transporter substrate-binding protein [Clostridiales bacterium]